MANWSNPLLTSTYTDFLTEVKARDVDLAKQFDGQTVSNLPTNAIRWDSVANRWKKWDGSSWVELTGTYALTGLSTTGALNVGTTLGVSGQTTLATATATTPATSDNNTNVATTAFVKAQGYAPLASPGLSGTPTAPTAALNTNNTQLATTAFVTAEIADDAPTKTGGGASGTWSIAISGNAATATNLSTTQGNWSSNGTISAVVGLLSWKNYGNGHVIFDASQGISPSGTAISSSDSVSPWLTSHPTLMGWNGVSTYGVRVDSARVANTALSANSASSVAASADQAIVNQENGNSSAWYGRILSKNATNDRAVFLGTYAGIAGVFAHNNALNAWADLYVNTSDGVNGGTVRLTTSVLLGGNQALHAGNYNTYAPTKTGVGATGVWPINVTGSSGICSGNAATATSAGNLTGTTTANINTSALASGTANASTFLRGDRTWQAALTEGTVIKTFSSVAVTGSFSVDFGALPSWVKKITLTVAGVSVNGSSSLLAQLGTSSGFTTSGYLGATSTHTGNNALNHSTGFLLTISSVSASVWHGMWTFCKLGGNTNTWVARGALSLSNDQGLRHGSGSVALPGTLSQLRFTTVSGSEAFDAGTMSILYEG